MADQESGSSSSRIRDHLANERTFLAWLRTAAAVMALGLAIISFGREMTDVSIAAGSLLVLTGAAGAGYGTVRYWRIGTQIDSERFDLAGRRGFAVVAAGTLVVAVIIALVAIIAAG